MRRIPTEIRALAKEKIDLFRADPFNPVLKSHRLKAALKGLWSFSIDYRHRIIFEFLDKGIVYFHSIGDHSMYD